MTQPPLFQAKETQINHDGLTIGRQLRDDALDRVANAAPGWSDRALEAVYQVALTTRVFATDAIWQAGLEKPREPRAMGPVMMRAVRLGYIERTQETANSGRAVQHARPLRLYRSLIYRP